MDKNTVWIVIPAYNAKKTLKKCIASIKKQTYKNWCAVLVDDGSVDGTGTYCDKLASSDSRIIAIHQPNSGPAAARRTGIKQIPDDSYCTFCDSDDTFVPEALEIMFSEISTNNADVVCANMQRMFKGITFPIPYTPPCFLVNKTYNSAEIMSDLYSSVLGFSNLPVNLVAKIYRTQKIKKIMLEDCKTPKKFAEDLDIILRLLPTVENISVTNKKVYNYRIGGGTARFMPEYFTDSIFMYNRKKEYAKYYTGNMNAEKLIASELKNIAVNYLIMCNTFCQFPMGGTLKCEAEWICTLPEIKEIATLIGDDNSGHPGSAEILATLDAAKITEYVLLQQKNDNKLKKALKKFLLHI